MAPGRREMDKADWLCRKCQSGGKPTFNKGFRESCFGCRVAKGDCHLGPAPAKEPSFSRKPGSPKQTLAERQKRAQDEKEKKDKAELRKDRKEIQKLQASLKKAQAANADLKKSLQKEQVEDAEMQEEEEVDKKESIKALLERIAFFKGPSQKDMPGSKDKLKEAELELEAVRKADLQTKPVDEQVRRARQKKEACSRALERSKKAQQELVEKEAKLQQEMAAGVEKIAKEVAELAEAEQQMELVLQRGGAKGGDSGDGSSPSPVQPSVAQMFEFMRSWTVAVAAKQEGGTEAPAAKEFANSLNSLESAIVAMQAEKQESDKQAAEQIRLQKEQQQQQLLQQQQRQKEQENAVRASGGPAVAATASGAPELGNGSKLLDFMESIMGACDKWSDESKANARKELTKLPDGESAAKKLKAK